MNAVFLITFREGLEAALIVGILLTAMRALGAQKQNFVIWAGVGAGIVLSLLFAWAFATFSGGFEGASEKIYEGVLMLAAAGIITHLIFWMKKEGRVISQKMKAKVKEHLSTGSLWMIGVLSMVAVVREGIEVVIFFQALMAQSDQTISLYSAVLGLLLALLVAVAIFVSTRKVPVARLFTWLSYFLILIAGGLLAHGLVELQGAGVLPTVIKPLYDLSAVFPEDVGLGAILKAGFGYDANPSLLAVIAYILYVGIVGRSYLKK